MKTTGGERKPEARVFVGRDRELGELRSGIAEAAAGHGRIFLVSGEPGMGKTRLASEAAAMAQASGARVLWGRCWEGDGAPAYWPWTQILRGCLPDQEPKALALRLGPGAVHLAQILPNLRERLGGPLVPASLEPEHARFYLFDAATNLLQAAASSSPLVLLLDDAHVADTPSLLLLRFVAREFRDSRIAMIVTYRDVEARRVPAVAEILDEVTREGIRIPLRGLERNEVARLVEKSSGVSPGEEILSALCEATGGNPLFVDEVVRFLVAEKRLDRETRRVRLGIPESLRDVIRRRFGWLPEDIRRILSTASVIGREFDLDVLSRVAEMSAAELTDRLREAVSAQILFEVPHARARYAFSHVLFRETLYDAQPTAERTRLHGRIADALVESRGTDLDQHLAEVSHHAYEAARGGEDPRRAVELARRAGDRALELFAYEDAASHYERALWALELALAENEKERCELLLSLGAARWKLGDPSESRATFVRAAAVARKLGDAERLARAALGYGGGVGGFALVVRADETLLGLLDEALRALAEGDSPLRVRVMAALAVELYWTNFVERSAAFSREAVAMADRLGDDMVRLVALYSRCRALPGPEGLEQRREAADEVLRLARALGDREMTFLGHQARLLNFLELGDLRAVHAEIEETARLVTELRQPFYRWQLGSLRAMQALLDGRLADAERFVLDAMSIAQRGPSEIAMLILGGQLFTLYWLQGRLGELEAATKTVADQYPWIVAWRSGLAFLYAELGREDDARAELEQLAANDFTDVRPDGAWFVAMSFIVWTCVALGDGARAAKLYPLLLPYAERTASTGGAALTFGPVSMLLGILAAAMGRWDDSIRHLELALEKNRATGAKPFTALTLHELAKALAVRRAPGDRERARALLEQALAMGRKLGMTKLVERWETLTPRLAQATPPALELADSPAANLFRKEGDYWTLSWDGKVVRLKTTKGLGYVAELLRHPGRELPAAELIAATEGQPDRRPFLGSAGAILDTKAKSEYRRRLADLREDLEDAERLNDLGRTDRVREEIGFFERELAAAVGAGGKDREAGSSAERARWVVTKRIKEALQKIRDAHPALGRELAVCIKTGNLCSYTPDPDRPAPWVF